MSRQTEIAVKLKPENEPKLDQSKIYTSEAGFLEVESSLDGSEDEED